MHQNNARKIALGGMLAAVAVVIMCLGGLIPVATYICPALCCAIAHVVFLTCGKRIAWSWYVVVSLLSLLVGPDKEAAIVFSFLGYYPLIKSAVDKYRFSILIKTIFFNCSVLTAYWVIIHLIGMTQVAEENATLGVLGVAILMVLGNVTFFLLDRMLNMITGKRR